MINRPNILMIMTDNQPADMLGCYGNDEVLTPHIDQLAATGTRFSNAFCVNAMCSPCRASVLTGLMPSAHGVHTWLDMYQDDVTLEGMMDGVRRSNVFLLILVSHRANVQKCL